MIYQSQALPHVNLRKLFLYEELRAVGIIAAGSLFIVRTPPGLGPDIEIDLKVDVTGKSYILVAS